MPVNKSQRFSLRLLLDQDWIDTLNDLSKAHMISRLGLIRKYIRAGMETDLQEIKEGISKLKSIEATKRELSVRVRKHEGIKRSSLNEPLVLTPTSIRIYSPMISERRYPAPGS